jgi:hypothetical protein
MITFFNLICVWIIVEIDQRQDALVTYIMNPYVQPISLDMAIANDDSF